MSEERISETPAPGNSGSMTTGIGRLPPKPDWPDDPRPLAKPPLVFRLLVRVICTAAAAAVFVGFCWLMGGSHDPNTLILSGPVWLLRTQDSDNRVFAIQCMTVLLPCMFAIGLWPRPATFVLAIFAGLAWWTVGLYTVGMSI